MAAIERNVRTWERGIIPFVISSEFVQGSDEFTQIALAINEYNLKTNIRFIPRTNEPDYIVFRNGSAGWCSSYVGKQGGEQSINCYLIGRQYSAGNLIHEIMHMIGFHHEHQRTDRDQFVLVDFSNVKRTFDFEKVNGENLTEYDYGSIMHYPRLITNTNLINDPKRDTIIPLRSLDFETILGQRGRLSEKDIQGINKLYPVLSNVEPFIFEKESSSTIRIIIIILLSIILFILLKRLFNN